MFFANGGGALPSLEEKTRHAGANALKAASEFWQMVSELENSKDPIAKGISSDRIERCASGLRSAAVTYDKLRSEIPMDRRFVEMTEFDLEVAAIDVPSFHDRSYLSGRWHHFDLRELDLPKPYLELSARLNIMADEMFALRQGGEKKCWLRTFLD